MADAEAKVKATIEAEDKTGSVFKQVGEKISTVEKSAGSLTSGLKTLGMAGAALYAGRELLNFLTEAGEMAIADEKAFTQLNGALQKMGKTIEATPEIKNFEQQMLQLGTTVGETEQAMSSLVRVTGSVEQSIYLTKLASDLASSGMGDLQSNVDALVGLYQGRARAAAQRFGLDMRENASAAETLAAIEGQVTVTTEQMAATNGGSLDVMKAQWEELKNKIGDSAIRILGSIASVINGLSGDKVDAQLQKSQNAVLNNLKKAVDAGNLSLETIKKGAETYKRDIGETAYNSLLGYAEALGTVTKKEQDYAKATSKDAENLNEKIKSSFADLSKNIVSQVNSQIDAIDKLKKSMQDLDEQTAESLDKSNEKYNQDVLNLAKKAQDRIKEIDRSIADENAMQSAGFRTRIAELQKEKAQEQSVIDRAGGQISNLTSELQKDEFTQLQESHQKELQEIKDTAEKKKLELQKEQLERQIFLEKAKLTVKEPGFYEKATSESLSFLGAIGAGQVANSFVFNFNGDVNDKDALQKSIIDALNRIAQLRQIGAK